MPEDDDSVVNMTTPQWHLIVDQYTSPKLSAFHATKNGMIKPFYKKLQKQAARGKPVLVRGHDKT